VAQRVMAAVEDLLFRSKISETAEQLGVEASFPRSPKKLVEQAAKSPPDLLVLDLNSARFEPLELLRELKSGEATKYVPVVGFLSHVQKDLAVAARESGCDRVMARSAFTRDLPEILAGDGGSDPGV
jgi:CheY-like chemotaxis protein